MMRRLTILISIYSGFFSSASLATHQDGVYKITHRDLCDAEKIDMVVIFEGLNGDTLAVLSSNRFLVDYQWYNLSSQFTSDSGGDLSGATMPNSRDVATLHGNIGLDLQQLSGTVDSVSCLEPWTFSAERLSPVLFSGSFVTASAPIEPSDFAGLYTATTGRTTGVLKIMQLPNGRIVANYGNDNVRRLLNFSSTTLDSEDASLDMYVFNEYDGMLQVKWHLHSGTVDGHAVLQGYGISRWGVYYGVSATKLEHVPTDF